MINCHGGDDEITDFSDRRRVGQRLIFSLQRRGVGGNCHRACRRRGHDREQVKRDGYMDPVFVFNPAFVSIEQGDTVQWIWDDDTHSTTSGSPGSPSGFWNSGVLNDGATFMHVFPDPGTFPYYCSVHGGCCGMIGTVYVAAATPTPTPAQPLNISTRMEVRTDEQVLIGGFIVTGNDPKELVLRAIGPSLGGVWDSRSAG